MVLSPTGPPENFSDDGEHQVAIHFVQAVRVHAERVQRVARHRPGDAALRAHFGEIAHAAEQAIGHARRAAAAASDFLSAPSSSSAMPRIPAERRKISIKSSGL